MVVKKLAENIYRISEWGAFGFVKRYLLVGTRKALLINSGYGKADLEAIVKRLTDKPVTLVNTHGHLDHANSSAAFDAYLHENDFNIYEQHSSPEFLKPYYKNHMIPHAEMKILSPRKNGFGR